MEYSLLKARNLVRRFLFYIHNFPIVLNHRLQGISLPLNGKYARNISIKKIVKNNSGGIFFLGNVEISEGAIMHGYGGRIRIGNNTFIGPYSVIYGHGGIEIGENTLISMHCNVLSSNHTIPSQSEKIRDKPDVLLPTKIGDDVWLGSGVIVLGGIKIGKGCIVGAGSVVTKDLPPYSISIGNPAKVIRYRDLK